MNVFCASFTFLLAVFLAGILNEVDGIPQRCSRNGRYVYDKCGQRCYCTANKLVKCTRIRKEFTSMSFLERFRYIRTIKKASTDPKYKAAYDKLITEHQTLFFMEIHDVDHFLTWHRYYILQYENLLRKVNCRFTVSYWDWSLVSANPWRTNFPSLWYGGSAGMGGNGSLPNRCVTTGPFRQGKWNLPSSAGGGCLTRDFFGNTPDAVAVEQLLRTPPAQFTDFEMTLRINLHDNVHCQIGGIMCSIDAAAAPEFFLHHGMVDKIWADWQKKSAAHKNAYFPNLNGKVIHTPYYPSQLIDLNNQPGGVRVVYQEPRYYGRVYGYMRRLSTSLLRKIPRRGFTALLPKTISFFRIRGSTLRRVQTLGRALQPSAKLRLSKMPTGSTSLESSVGFRLRKPTNNKAVATVQRG